jgi:hypothetical protein
VNSFGLGGANCHVLLKSNPKLKINNSLPEDDLPRLIACSGRTREAVDVLLSDVCHSWYIMLQLFFFLIENSSLRLIGVCSVKVDQSTWN